MKLNTKTASKAFLATLLLLGLSLALTRTASAMAQITMVNRTQDQLTLYISDDGGQTWYFGCGPVLGIGKFTNSPGMSCTSGIPAGSHVLEARKGDEVVQKESVTLGESTSPSWTVTVEEAPTLEGQWMVQSSWDKNAIGRRYTITRQGDDYQVTFSSPNPTKSHLFHGTPTQITTTYTPSYDDLLYMFTPGSNLARTVVRNMANHVTDTLRITLSSDGQSAEYDSGDYTKIAFDPHTGRLLNSAVTPFARKETLVRISLR
jgi:hypothetical protein